MSTTETPKLALVTGATGFIGAEIALEFLRSGFVIRQSVRKQEQADLWTAKYPKYKDRVSFVVIESLEAPGAFDEAVRGVTYIAHSASPVNFAPKDNKKDVLDPAIAGFTGILESAKKEPGVKAIVITSSIMAFFDFMLPLPTVGDTIKADGWNPVSYELAASLPTEAGYFVYGASKALAERAAWDFMKRENPSFTLTTLSPSWVFGYNSEPALRSWADLRSTYGITTKGLLNKEGFPPSYNDDFVDVNDVAKAHVRAVTLPIAAGKRYLLSGGRFSYEEAARLAAEAVPELKEQLFSVEGKPFKATYEVDSGAVTTELGVEYTPLAATMRKWAQQAVALPK